MSHRFFYTVDIDYPRRTLERLPKGMGRKKTRVPITPPPPVPPLVPPPVIPPEPEPPLPVATEFTELPSGYILQINSDGLASVTRGGVTCATGNLQYEDGTWYYEPFQSRSHSPTVATKSCTYVVAGADVVHTYTGVFTGSVTYRYRISGDDLNISCLVTNNGDTTDIPAFRSPRWQFASFEAAKASSNQLGWDQSHTQNNPAIRYPSSNVPFGASYVMTVATGGVTPINVCIMSRESAKKEWMALGHGTGLPGVAISSFFFEPVLGGGGTKTFNFTYRFSATADRENLLSTYKSALRAELPITYTPDVRPVLQCVACADSLISQSNPYGYTRRFDILANVNNYVNGAVPPMLAGNYQGVIFWQPQGAFKNCQYRPDFDNWPVGSGQATNMSTLVSGFTSQGLKAGLLSRPGVYVVPDGAPPNDSLTAASDDPTDLSNKLGVSLTWAKDHGWHQFYLDSAATSLRHENIVQFIRSRIGTEQTFTEFSSALTLPYSCRYMELRYTNGVYVYPNHYTNLSYLYPEVVWLTKFLGALPPGGYPALYDYMLSHKLTPLVQDDLTINNPSGHNAALNTAVATYISGTGWNF